MKKLITHLFFAVVLCLLSINSYAQMVLKYNITSPNTQIALPLAGTVNVSVDWGDGAALEAFTTTGNKPHTFTSTGTKTVTITGTLTAYGVYSNTDVNSKLIQVVSWNGLGLTSFNYAFINAYSLTTVPGSLPTTVTDLSYMFYNADAFNQPIGAWNTSAVTDMRGMFYDASAFNQPIGTWNTAAVTYMGGMFSRASAFNQPIGTWNTAAVTDMFSMFGNASSFNQPIGTWNTAAVTNMGSMFHNATAFNQPIGTWNIAAVTSMSSMFDGAALCTDNYDNLLNGWAPQAVKTGVLFHGGTSKYSSASATARATLIGKGWTITDAGTGTTAGTKCTNTAIEGELASAATGFSVFPNPSNGAITIQLNKEETFSLSNSLGQIVRTIQLNQTTGNSATISGLEPGLYFLTGNSNTFLNYKIIVE